MLMMKNIMIQILNKGNGGIIMKTFTNFSLYKNFTISLMFTLIFCSEINGQTSVYVYPSNIAYTTGRVDIFGKYEPLIRAGKGSLGQVIRGWATFNIASIPDDATIQNLELRIYVSNASSSSNHDLDIGQMTIWPPSSTASALLTETNNNNYNASPSSEGTSTGTKYITLNGNARSYFQKASLAVDWFGVSFMDYQNDDNDCDIYGYDQSTSLKPRLEVTYTIPSCTMSVISGSTVSSSSGTKSISVTSNDISTWTASESCSWVSLSPSSGTGDGTVTATYQQNISCSSRSCTITFSCGSSSDSYTLTQDGASCIVSVPSGSTVSSISGTANISVTSNSCSSWSANESCSWVSLSPSSGTGDGTVTATYQQNTSGDSRSCTITFSCGSSSDSYTLTQEAIPCTVSVPSGSSVVSGSGTKSISVTSNGTSSWSASENCSWVTLTSSSGTGNGTAEVDYQLNSSCNYRSCAIYFTCGSSSVSYSLTQDGIYSSVSVPSGTSVSSSSGTESIPVTSNGCSSWSASVSCSWITLSSSSGTGNGTITANYEQNTSTNSRSCTINFTSGSGPWSEDTYTLNQSAESSGIEDIDFIKYINLYPNPTKSELIIEVDITKPENLEIKLINLDGKLIYEEKLDKYHGKYQKKINVDNYVKGIYNLQLLTIKGTINKKFVIQ